MTMDDDDHLDAEAEQLETVVSYQAVMAAAFYRELRQQGVPLLLAMILTIIWLGKFMNQMAGYDEYE